MRPVAVNNPHPAISGLSPNRAYAGGPSFTLSLSGSGFVPSSVVRWNGADRPTTFISSTLLTAAIPATEEDYKHYDLKVLSRHMNYLNLMAYDMHWNGEKITNFHSALLFHDHADLSRPPADTHYAAHAMQDFLRAGVPARKIVLGVPFYGKGWTGVSNINHGLYQPAKDASKSPPEYHNLKALPESADRQFYPKLGTCSIWSNGEFFSYDCPQAMRLKQQYIRRHRLAGVMFWEMGQDTSDAELLKSLVAK